MRDGIAKQRALEISYALAVNLDGFHGAGLRNEELREHTHARTYLEHGQVGTGIDGVGYALCDIEVDKEVLSQVFLRSDCFHRCKVTKNREKSQMYLSFSECRVTSAQPKVTKNREQNKINSFIFLCRDGVTSAQPKLQKNAGNRMLIAEKNERKNGETAMKNCSAIGYLVLKNNVLPLRKGFADVYFCMSTLLPK